MTIQFLTSKRYNKIVKAGIYLLILFSTPFAAFWLLNAPIAWWVNLIHNHVLQPYGIDELPPYLNEPISAILLLSPFVIIASITYYLFSLKTKEDNADRFATQLQKIGEAKNNLSDSIGYLDELKTSIEKAKEHEKLMIMVDQLSSLSDEKTDQLKKKLEAIAYINRRSDYIKLFISFVLGIITSLIASAISVAILK